MDNSNLLVKAWSHCTSTQALCREQRHRHQNCIYILENLPWNSSTSILTPSITGKTSCYNGTGFIDDLFLVKLVYSYTSGHHQRRILMVQYQIQHQSNVRVRIGLRETRIVTQPIKQCRRKGVSEQKLRIHDKYGETRFFFFEDMMRDGDDKDCEQVLNVT